MYDGDFGGLDQILHFIVSFVWILFRFLRINIHFHNLFFNLNIYNFTKSQLNQLLKIIHFMF